MHTISCIPYDCLKIILHPFTVEYNGSDEPTSYMYHYYIVRAVCKEWYVVMNTTKIPVPPLQCITYFIQEDRLNVLNWFK